MSQLKKAELLVTCTRTIIISILIVLILGGQKVSAKEPVTIKHTDYLEKEIQVLEDLAQESDSVVQLTIESSIEYSDRDLDLMARVIHAEAGICDDLEKYRVGNVVLNRKKDESGSYGDTIKSVIYQKGQFSSVDGKNWNETPTDREYEIAENLLNGIRVLPANIVWFAQEHRYGTLYDKSEWHYFSGY